MSLYDHIDLRVKDLAKVRALYDVLLPAIGFSRLEEDGENVNYHLEAENRSQPFFGLMSDSQHRPNGTRIAFRAVSRDDVDRLADIARLAGARSLEGPEDYGGSPQYYAAFFEDVDGNKLEICFRE
ncbi:MAG TPA: VOC family protein [Candidatus Tumulicola sp.]|jgi:predicted lactoylglutathione lyase